jgi:monoamine oxidase
MPRTPLLSRVVAACAAARTSLHTGVPVDELLGGAPVPPTPNAAVTRRAFLGYAAAGAGLAACAGAERAVGVPATLRTAKGDGAGTRVAVVGAGLAGLTCAYRLRQDGVHATVYEASGRLGGRCWTRRDSTFAGGQLAERGGELIDQSHTSIRHLAQELGLPLDNVLAAEARGTEALYWFDGRAYTPADAARDLKPVWQPLHRDYVEAGYPTLYTSSTARGRELDLMSVREWIARTVPGGLGSQLGRLLDVAYTIEYGADTASQSALNLVYLLGSTGQGQVRLFGKSNEKYKVQGGNDRLVTGLVAGLGGGQIVTGAALSAVRRAGAAWTLQFESGRAVTADRVVLALPFSILNARVDTGAAGFPAVKKTAIKELGMGQNAKLALQFSTRHWATLGNNGDTFSDRGYQATWEATRAQSGAAGILVDYTGGAAAVAQSQSGKTAAALADQFLAQVAPVLPGLGAKYTKRVAFEDWPAHEWTRGSYSYWKVGQYQGFAGAEREEVAGCHFAGEHTSVDAQGYLEGAVESGERAAREVLAALGVISHA